ncbi:MAG: STAS domain-containing protein [Verrucomicrobiota bacterium]
MQIERTGTQSFLGRAVRQDGRVRLVLRGELNISIARELGRALSRAARLGANVLIIDLSSADLADSAALGALVLAQKEARRNESDVVLAGVTGKTRHVLEITGLDRAFRIVPTDEER